MFLLSFTLQLYIPSLPFPSLLSPLPVPLIAADLDSALEMGMDWSVREGYAWAEDKEHCEEYGRMLQADPSKVRQGSRRKRRRRRRAIFLSF
jgi:hypothetical protein